MEIIQATFIKVIPIIPTNIPTNQQQVGFGTKTKIFRKFANKRETGESDIEIETDIYTTVFLDILTTLIKFTYAFLFSPFRIATDRNDSSGKEKFTNVSWLPQKVACFLLLISGLFLQLKPIQEIFPLNKHSPADYFSALLPIVRFCLMSTSVYTFWFGQDAFIDLANKLHSFSKYQSATGDNIRCHAGMLGVAGNRLLRLLPRLIYLSIGVGVLVCVGIDITCLKGTQWPFAIFGKLRPFPSNESLEECFKNLPVVYSWTDYLISIIGGIGSFHWHVSWVCCHLTLLVCVMMLWLSSYSFIANLERYKNKYLNDIFGNELLEILTQQCSYSGNAKSFDLSLRQRKWEREFKYLQELSSLVNKIIQSSVSFYIFETILYYSIIFIEIGKLQEAALGLTSYLGVAMKTCLTLVILRFSADIPQQIKWVKVWYSLDLAQSPGNISTDQLSQIFDEINRGAIGIRCNGICTLTYGLVANMAGLIVTFFTISLQATKSLEH